MTTLHTSVTSFLPIRQFRSIAAMARTRRPPSACEPETACCAQGHFHFLRKLVVHTPLTCGDRRACALWSALEGTTGPLRCLVVVGRANAIRIHPETLMFPCSRRCMHAVCIRRMRFAYTEVCGLHTGGMVSNLVSTPRRPHRLRAVSRIPVARVRRPDHNGAPQRPAARALERRRCAGG